MESLSTWNMVTVVMHWLGGSLTSLQVMQLQQSNMHEQSKVIQADCKCMNPYQYARQMCFHWKPRIHFSAKHNIILSTFF